MSRSRLEVLEQGDPRWSALVAEADADVFYTPEFCRFRLEGAAHEAVMLRYDDESLGVVFDVTTLRDVSKLAFYGDLTADAHGAGHATDLASPEYNGPVILAAAGEGRAARVELLARYRRAVNGYCKDTGVVTEFVRLHPLVAGGDDVALLAEQEALVDASELVYVDLQKGYAEAERGYRKGHRAAIKRAAREGCRVDIVAPDAAAILRLATLYGSTMARSGADPRYRHGDEFFRSLFAHLGDRAMLVEARSRDGALASTAVFLRGGRALWYLYAGTDEAARAGGANNFQIDRMVHWAAENGLAYLVLGGGFSRGDGLFLTKRGYSHLSATVRHLRKVHDPERLRNLVATKMAFDARQGRASRTDYFPSYWQD